jgi:hypothetical protein
MHGYAAMRHPFTNIVYINKLARLAEDMAPLECHCLAVTFFQQVWQSFRDSSPKQASGACKAL